MSESTGLWEFLKGKKTYIGLALGGVVVLAHKAGLPMPGVQIDDQAYIQNLWMLALGAAARHGLDNSSPAVVNAGKAVAALLLAIVTLGAPMPVYAADMAVKVPALPQVANVYPTRGCGMFYGVNAEGGSGVVNGAPAGTVAIGGDIGALVGFACPTSGIPWFVEADFDFQNLNAGNNGFAMKGPAHFSQLVGVQTPLLSWFGQFINVGQGNIPAITPLLPPGVSINGAPQNYVAFVAAEDDISSSFAGVSSGRSWLFSPGVRTGLLFNVTGPNGVKAVADTYAGIQFQSNAQCFGIVPTCPKLGDRFVAGFSLKM